MGPVPRRWRSSSSAPTAAVSSTSTPAHPFENPTPLSNFLELLAILLIPAALCYTFGKMVGDTRQGWAVLAAMLVMLVLPVRWPTGSRQHGNPRLAALGVDQTGQRHEPRRQHGGQGGSLRHRQSALWATATTAASNGSVNSMHDSYTPLGGLVPLVDDAVRRDDFRRRRDRACTACWCSPSWRCSSRG